MFDQQSFMKAKLEARTDAVSVPGLVHFFEEGTDPVWIVRGLTGVELARASDAGGRSKRLEALISALSSKMLDKTKVATVRSAFGLSDDDVPEEMAKRMEMLVTGSVDPKIDLSVAVRLAESYPIEFYELTNKITILTGQGAIDVGKQQPFGNAQMSEPL
jgi:hypothetical protein